MCRRLLFRHTVFLRPRRGLGTAAAQMVPLPDYEPIWEGMNVGLGFRWTAAATRRAISWAPSIAPRSGSLPGRGLYGSARNASAAPPTAGPMSMVMYPNEAKFFVMGSGLHPTGTAAIQVPGIARDTSGTSTRWPLWGTETAASLLSSIPP